MSAEVMEYKRSPWGLQKWYVLITDPVTQEQFICGHSHTSAELAARCAIKQDMEWKKEVDDTTRA